MVKTAVTDTTFTILIGNSLNIRQIAVSQNTPRRYATAGYSMAETKPSVKIIQQIAHYAVELPEGKTLLSVFKPGAQGFGYLNYAFAVFLGVIAKDFNEGKQVFFLSGGKIHRGFFPRHRGGRCPGEIRA